MDHYQEIRILPDGELQPMNILTPLFARLHLALVEHGKGDIGISLPEHGITPGTVIRIHGTRSALEALAISSRLAGMQDYCLCTPLLSVPPIKGWRTVTRVQVKSNTERLLRRSLRKGWLTEEEAAQRRTEIQDRRCTSPFIQIKSASTGQGFRLFIRHGELSPTASDGVFSSYGLSNTATIPWF